MQLEVPLKARNLCYNVSMSDVAEEEKEDGALLGDESSAVPGEKVVADSSTLEFKSENIGNWISHQEGYFAEQNRKAAEKCKMAEQIREKVRPIVFMVGGLVVIGLAIWGVVALISSSTTELSPLPDDITLGSEGAQEVQDQAQDIWQEALQGAEQDMGDVGGAELEAKGVAAVTDYFDKRAGQASAMNVKIDLALIEMALFVSNGQPEAAIKSSERVSPDEMNDVQKSQYYGMLMNVYYGWGDTAKGDEYSNLLERVNNEDVEVEG